jgi:hypothetical protein
MPAKKTLAFNVTETGCFEVISHVAGRSGYPSISIHGKLELIHRHIWKECFGDIPEGMFVCHKCDNRVCINPEHLFLGTQGDNLIDMASKGRSTRGEKDAMARLTEIDVRDIRSRYTYGDKVNGNNALAREYGMSPAQISRIHNGKRWGWLS